MKKNQKGFGVVESLLIVIIVLIVGFVGYYVYHTKNNTDSTYNNTAKNSGSLSSNPYAGWKSYSDDFVSLKYPGTWAAVRDDNTSLPDTMELKLRGPNDTVIAKSTGIEASDKASVVLTIFKNSKAGQNTLNSKIYDLKKLDMQQLPGAKLVVTSDASLGGDPATPPSALNVTTDGSAKVGATKLSTDLTVGSNTINIWAEVADNDATGARISNLSLFEQSQSFKEVIKMLNSLNFK